MYSGNEILISIKGHNYVTNLQKMAGNNPNLDFVHFKAFTKFGLILSNFSEDIVRISNFFSMFICYHIVVTCIAYLLYQNKSINQTKF